MLSDEFSAPCHLTAAATPAIRHRAAPCRRSPVTRPAAPAEIPAAWLARWRDLSSLEGSFHVPEVNAFVARSFALVEPDVPHTPHPKRVVCRPDGELFYRRDCKFNLPRAYISARLCSDLPVQSALK